MTYLFIYIEFMIYFLTVLSRLFIFHVNKKMGAAYVGGPHLLIFLLFQNWVDCGRVEPAIKFPPR